MDDSVARLRNLKTLHVPGPALTRLQCAYGW